MQLLFLVKGKRLNVQVFEDIEYVFFTVSIFIVVFILDLLSLSLFLIIIIDFHNGTIDMFFVANRNISVTIFVIEVFNVIFFLLFLNERINMFVLVLLNW